MNDYGSRWDTQANFASSGQGYSSPGWQRAQRAATTAGRGSPYSRQQVIEGEGRLVAVSEPGASTYKRGERVFHQKFGYGQVLVVEGNKLTVAFDKAGEKKVIDSFVERAG
jgi:DNA helicase-2/ATP-dependent DNA helicase PcrA